jgi:hypothetical protein
MWIVVESIAIWQSDEAYASKRDSRQIHDQMHIIECSGDGCFTFDIVIYLAKDAVIMNNCVARLSRFNPTL